MGEDEVFHYLDLVLEGGWFAKSYCPKRVVSGLLPEAEIESVSAVTNQWRDLLYESRKPHSFLGAGGQSTKTWLLGAGDGTVMKKATGMYAIDNASVFAAVSDSSILRECRARLGRIECSAWTVQHGGSHDVEKLALLRVVLIRKLSAHHAVHIGGSARLVSRPHD